MGRYYSGDIEGKFWFGVQDSDDASFFGGAEEDVCDEESPEEPYAIDYFFQEGDLDEINHGVMECEENLGEFTEKLDQFFDENTGYNEQILSDYLGVDKAKVSELLVWYARRILGLKILNCVEENGTCSFTADLY